MGPVFRVRLRSLPTDQGGRRGPIYGDDRPRWDVGYTWLGQPTIRDGRVFLEDRDQLAPGEEGHARVEPVVAEHWGSVGRGTVLAVHEGGRVVGHAEVIEVIAPAYWSPEVATFVVQARQLCAFVERAHELSLEQRVDAASQRLLALYDAGARLPRVEPPVDVDAPDAPAPPATWPGFGALDPYWAVLDPYEPAEPGVGDLSDDLLDVYRDLRRGLALWDDRDATTRDALRVAAIWEWRFHFDHHWGDHAINALRALHEARRRT